MEDTPAASGSTPPSGSEKPVERYGYDYSIGKEKHVEFGDNWTYDEANAHASERIAALRAEGKAASLGLLIKLTKDGILTKTTLKRKAAVEKMAERKASEEEVRENEKRAKAVEAEAIKTFRPFLNQIEKSGRETVLHILRASRVYKEIYNKVKETSGVDGVGRVDEKLGIARHRQTHFLAIAKLPEHWDKQWMEQKKVTLPPHENGLYQLARKYVDCPEVIENAILAGHINAESEVREIAAIGAEPEGEAEGTEAEAEGEETDGTIVAADSFLVRHIVTALSLSLTRQITSEEFSAYRKECQEAAAAGDLHRACVAIETFWTSVGAEFTHVETGLEPNESLGEEELRRMIANHEKQEAMEANDPAFGDGAAVPDELKQLMDGHEHEFDDGSHH